MQRNPLFDPVTVRPTTGKVLTVAIAVVLGIGIVALVSQGGIADLARYGLLSVAGAYVCWMLFWFPCVVVDPSGITIRNIARTYHVTWPAVVAIETKYAFTIRTAGKSIVAWSAPSPGRYNSATGAASSPRTERAGGESVRGADNPRSESGLAAFMARRQWNGLREAGYLDSGTIDGTGVSESTHVVHLAIGAALIVAALGLAILL